MIQIKATGNTLDRDGAHALLDALSPDRPGLLFGRAYQLVTVNGNLAVELNKGESDFSASERAQIEAELSKAIQLPKPPPIKTPTDELEEIKARLQLLESRQP